MAQERRKIQIGDAWYEGVPVEVNQANEYWNTYLLDDGTELRIKTVVMNIHRVDEKLDQQGNPTYYVAATTLVDPRMPPKKE